VELVPEILPMKRLLISGIACFTFFSSRGQGLIVNGNFEDRNTCVEFLSNCAPEGWFRFPYVKLQLTHNERLAAGMHQESLIMEHRSRGIPGRTYLYTRLVCRTEPGRMYRFKVSVFTNGHTYDHLDLVFAPFEPQRNWKEILAGKAQTYRLKLTRPSPYVNDWREASVTFKATGEERYLLLGNIDKSTLPFTRNYRYEDPLIIYDIDSASLLPVDGKWVPCTGAEEERKLLYLNNYRHTDFNYLDDEPPYVSDTFPAKLPPAQPVTTPPALLVEKTDTLLIPDVLFDFDKGSLNPRLFDQLNSIVQVIEQKKYRSIEVVGHTDNKGTATYNQQLSEQRARSVMTYLISRLGLSPQSIRARGLGATVPVTSNATPEGRRRNRRVEVLLLH
jgi:outer membrane protein OmpA-like peptidoglycan-associated protein